MLPDILDKQMIELHASRDRSIRTTVGLFLLEQGRSLRDMLLTSNSGYIQSVPPISGLTRLIEVGVP